MFKLLGLLFVGIFNFIKMIFRGIFNLIASIIHGLSLTIPFFYMLTGLILHLIFGILDKSGDFFYIFHFGLVVVFGISIILTVRKIAHPKPTKAPEEEHDNLEHVPGYYDKPKVYRVRNNPEYIVYEFYDKYQLFHESRNGRLEYVRTDMKEESYHDPVVK